MRLEGWTVIGLGGKYEEDLVLRDEGAILGELV